MNIYFFRVNFLDITHAIQALVVNRLIDACQFLANADLGPSNAAMG